MQGYPDENEESRLPQLIQSGKRSLYGSVVGSVQAQLRYYLSWLPSECRLEKLHFNQDGIKRSGVAHVGKFFGSKDVNIAALTIKLGPI